jgi:CBS domain-containing protein
MPASLPALLRNLPGCAGLAPETLAAIADASRVEEIPGATRLVREGEAAPDWYCVVDAGVLQVSRGTGGAEMSLDRLTDGDVLDPGVPGLPAAWSATTEGAARCVFVPQSVVAGSRSSAPAPAPRGDVVLFVRKVADLVKGPPVTCEVTASVADAARVMTRRRVGAPVGIVTDRDLRSKVLASGLAPGTPVTAVMSSPVVSIAPDALAFDALLTMTRLGIHHLAVAAGTRLEGVISSHDVILLHGAHPVGLARDFDSLPSIDALAGAVPRIQGVVKWLTGEGVGTFDVGRIVAELNDRLVRRAIGFSVARLEDDGHGLPPVPFAWLAAGSEGRREQTLKTDQDNGLVYRDPPPELRERAAAYFGRLAAAVGEALVRLGFPPCEGGFMASNPTWCQPDSTWRGYFSRWMDTPEPLPVLRASIFFDLRPVAGDEPLGAALWAWVCERAPSQTLFLRYMAKAALERHVPLGLFGGFVVERSGAHKDALDLKARGVFPVTQALRVYALSLGLSETNTVGRLIGVAAQGLMTEQDARDLRDAYELICRLRLTRQLACLDAGSAPDNFVNPETLAKADRLLLKEAFKTVAWLQRVLEDRFQAGLVG